MGAVISSDSNSSSSRAIVNNMKIIIEDPVKNFASLEVELGPTFESDR